MKALKIALIFSVFLFLQSTSAQNSLNVQITGPCSSVNEVYPFVGLFNNKNSYAKSLFVGPNPVTITICYDGAKWVLHNGSITDFGFFNDTVPAGVLPPLTGWQLGSCTSGTMSLSQVLSTNQIEKSEFSVYPNPTKDFIAFISSRNYFEKVNYVIHDVSGRQLMSGITAINEKIDIQKLPAGSIFLSLTLNDETINRFKIIKSE